MKLFKNNRLDQGYELTPAEIAGLFMTSQEYQDWLDDSGWPLDRHIIAYLSGAQPNGLHSVMDCTYDGIWTKQTADDLYEVNKIVREASRQ